MSDKKFDGLVDAPASYQDMVKVLEGSSYAGFRKTTEDTRRIFTLDKDLHVFKAAKHNSFHNQTCIINMIIPAGSRVHIGEEHGFVKYKCRSDKAIVHSIVALDRKYSPVERAWSSWDTNYTYTPGEQIIHPKEAFHDRFGVCASGLHFFMDIGSALAYFGNLTRCSEPNRLRVAHY